MEPVQNIEHKLHLHCPIHASSGQLLVHVCINPTCKQQPLLCLLCKEQSHPTHLTSSITKFTSDVQNSKQRIYGAHTLNKQISQIKQQRTKFLHDINKVKTEIFEIIDKNMQLYCAALDDAEMQIRSAYDNSYGRKFYIDSNSPIEKIFEEVTAQRNHFYNSATKKQHFEMDLKNIVIKANQQLTVLVKRFQEDIESRVKQIGKCSVSIEIRENPDEFDIFVKTLSGSTVVIKGVTSNTKIEQIKAKNEILLGNPRNKQNFIFAGMDLENGRTLGYYKIIKHCTIYDYLRLSGD